MARIGFIGLGHMGLPMAINLVNAGHHVTGYDQVSTPLSILVEAGGIAAPTLNDAIRDKEVIITMLQTGDQVNAVCLGPQGAFANAESGTLFIDCSSIDIEEARTLHREAEKNTLFLLDAPVSGGVAGAKAKTLTIMVGGKTIAFEKAMPIFECLGKNIIYTGAAGNGQAAKICNNMVLGISMIAVSEAFTLAKNTGLSCEKLWHVLSHSSGQCWVVDHYVPVPGLLEQVPANHQYQPGFTAAMMLKDLRLSQHAAKAAGIKTPMGEQATALYDAFNQQGMAMLDFSAIIKILEQS